MKLPLDHKNKGPGDKILVLVVSAIADAKTRLFRHMHSLVRVLSIFFASNRKEIKDGSDKTINF